MIRKHKTQILLSSLLILLPLVIGFFLWHMLPEQIATHWNIDGSPDGWSGLGFAIFSVPVILFVFHWICILITAHDTKNQSQSSKVFCMVLWILPIISLTTSSMIYAQALGMDIHIGTIARILFALLFLFLGNYMPKCRQNSTIGVKIRWTLKNEENWNKTHRLAGKVWVYGGILMMLFLLLIPTEQAVNVIWIGIFFLVFVPMIYSYLYYKKQLEKGEVTKEEMKASLVEKKITLGVILAVIVIVLLVFQGDYEIQLGSTSLFIDAKYWKDITISYEEIDEVAYYDTKEGGTRMYGYGTPFLVMGECRNSVWGSYTAYLHEKTKPCIFLRVNDKILVINGENEERTKEYYEQLKDCVKAAD